MEPGLRVPENYFSNEKYKSFEIFKVFNWSRKEVRKKIRLHNFKNSKKGIALYKRCLYKSKLFFTLSPSAIRKSNLSRQWRL